MKIGAAVIALLIVTPFAPAPGARAADDFQAVVKAIEQFYHVKHEDIPFLARAGMKVARTAARVKGGEAKRLAEAGSIRVAMFEDQDFNSRGRIASFKSLMKSTLGSDWSIFVQTLAPKDEEQTHIFLREAGEKFQVLLITIERREATVVQANVKPEVVKMLLRNPTETGKDLIDEATIIDN